MSAPTTIRSNWLKQPHEGYIVNHALTGDCASDVTTLQAALTERLGDSIYITPPQSLHITLLDWIAPLVDYGVDKQTLLKDIYKPYDQALRNATQGIGAFSVHFSELRVSPSAIYIRGTDHGQFDQMRKHFTDNIELIAGTKLPPTIIHSSLARFTQEIPLSSVQKAVDALTIDSSQDITTLRLIHSRREPMLDAEILQTYKLATPTRTTDV